MKRTNGDEDPVIDDNPFETVSEHTLTTKERFRQTFNEWIVTPIGILWSDNRTRVGVLILLLYILMGTVGIWILEPPETGYPIYVSPFQNWHYILGTNGVGQPILRQLVFSTPSMLKMIAAGAVFATVLGTFIGTVAGYKGGTIDTVLMTISDIGMTIPGLPLIIVIAAIFEPRSPIIVGLLLVINTWAGLARSVRSQVLTIREESYVEAARCIGIPTFSIVRNEILPNIMPYVMISFVNAARYVIFASVGLYFLGVLPFTTLNWGVMLNLAYNSGALYTLSSIHALAFPMLAIVLLSYGLILVSQGSDRLFNARVRARHAGEESQQLDVSERHTKDADAEMVG